MRIQTGFDIAFTVQAPTPMILMLNVSQGREADLEAPETIRSDPPVPMTSYLDVYGNRCQRLTAPPGAIRFSSASVIRDSGTPDAIDWSAPQHDLAELPPETLQFLLGSRYCETDRLMGEAWGLFGHIPPGMERVREICNFANRRILFNYQNARNTRTALEGYQEGTGVCRDYAHLAITLCRCMNIPARYCTGYLGDIGVPPVPDPMDFSAWFEVYMGGRWITFDARHNVPRIGRIVMARGRDATDVAIATIFGPHALSKFEVTTYELPEATVPA